MTLHASHYHRVLKRQIRCPGDSIWISDHLLATAFERYCRVSKTGHRNAGNVPGPLESQRRLGKRQMGDLNVHHASSAPSWAFAVPLNLSQWQWEPPKPSSQLQYGPRIGLARRLTKWLERLAYPELNDPSEITLDPTCSPVAKANLSWRAEIDAFLLLDPAEPADVLEAATRSFCHRFRQVVLLGQIPPEIILSTFTEIWDRLDAIHGAPLLRRELHLELCSALITGISASRVLEPSLFDAPFWRVVAARLSRFDLDEQVGGLFVQIMNRMSKLAFNDEVCDVWHLIMSHIPITAMSAISEGVLSMFDSVLSVWASSTDSTLISRMPTLFVVDPLSNNTPEETISDIRCLVDPMPQQSSGGLARPLEFPDAAMLSHLGRLRTISLAMRLVSSVDETHSQMLDAVTQMVLEKNTDSRTAMHSLRYNWMFVLAQIPDVRQTYFLETIAQLEHRVDGADLFSNPDLCMLMLIQWNSRGYLLTPESICRNYDYWFRRTDGDTALVCLGFAMWEHIPTTYIRPYWFSIWKILGRLQRVDQMGDSIETILVARSQNPMNSSTIKLGLRFLETVAWTSYNHIFALRIFFMYKEYMPQYHNRLRQWNPMTWASLYLAMLHDEKLPVGIFWEALEMDMYENPPEDTGRLVNQHHGYYGDRRARMVRKVLPSFLTVPRFSDRQVFRHVSQCVLFLERHRDGVTPDDILVLYESVVGRHLKIGLPGQSTRLDWLVEVIRRNFGTDIELTSRKQLLLWRKVVKHEISMKRELEKREPEELELEKGECQEQVKPELTKSQLQAKPKIW